MGLTQIWFRRVVVVMLVAAPVFAVLFWWGLPLLEDLTAEDGLTEYLSAVLYLVAAVVFALVGLRGDASRLWMVPLVLISVLVGGEEVSWGQRLLDYGTPGSLESTNVQGEANLHNIEGIHGNVRAAVVLFFLTGFVLLPLARRLWRPVAAVVARLRFPLPPLVVAPVVLAALAFMVAPRLAGLEGGELFVLDEVGELYLSVAWVLFAWDVHSSGSRPVRHRSPNSAKEGLRDLNGGLAS